MSAKLASALAHARAGWPVFPCHNMDRGRCSCREATCKSPGKHPHTRNGLKDATREEAAVRRWWSKWPDANIAGRCDGKVVADVDAGAGKKGLATLADLEGEHGRLERALVQRTGGGGLHIVFAARDGASYPGKLGKHIDIKAGPGAYIMLPGSDHRTGGSYAWEVGEGASEAYTGDLPYAPAWMERPAAKGAALGDLEEVMRERDRLPIGDVKDILNALPEPFVYDYLDWLKVGQALHHHFAGDEDGRHLWHWHSKASGAVYGGAEIDGKWPTFIHDKGGVTIGSLIHAAGGWANIGRDSKRSENRKHAPTLEIFWGDDADGADDLQPLIEGFLFKRALAALYGQYGEGKSFVALDMALSIATGRPWFGHEVERGPVLYVAPEGYTGLKRRRAAWVKHRGLGRTPKEFALVRGSMNLMKPDRVTLESLAAEAHRCKAVLIVLDTLNAIFGGADENDSAAMSKARHELERLRDLSGAAVLAIHHAGKDLSRGLRGSSVLGGALDTALLIHEGRIVSRPPRGKQKDMEAAGDIAFALQSVDLGKDRNGRPMGSAVAIPASVERFEETESMNERETAALDALARLHWIAELCGEAAVTIEAWRRAFYRAEVIATLSAESKRKAFQRVREELKAQIKVIGDNVELTP